MSRFDSDAIPMEIDNSPQHEMLISIPESSSSSKLPRPPPKKNSSGSGSSKWQPRQTKTASASVYTSKTASTASSSGTWESQGSSGARSVTWGDLPSESLKKKTTTTTSEKSSIDVSKEKIDQINLLPNCKERKQQLRQQLSIIAHQIKKAARVELSLRDSAADIRTKRDNLAAACGTLKATVQDKEGLEQSVRAEIESVQSEIAKAGKLERSYLKKSQHVHDKRYRLTQLYEHAVREMQRIKEEEKSASPVQTERKLPPLQS